MDTTVLVVDSGCCSNSHRWNANQWKWAWHWQMVNVKCYQGWPSYLSNHVFHICTAYRMKRRYAYRSSSTSVTTSVTLSERSELSESVDAYFGGETPSQLDQVHHPIPRPRHPIRELNMTLFLALICIWLMIHQLNVMQDARHSHGMWLLVEMQMQMHEWSAEMPGLCLVVGMSRPCVRAWGGTRNEPLNGGMINWNGWYCIGGGGEGRIIECKIRSKQAQWLETLNYWRNVGMNNWSREGRNVWMELQRYSGSCGKGNRRWREVKWGEIRWGKWSPH